MRDNSPPAFDETAVCIYARSLPNEHCGMATNSRIANEAPITRLSSVARDNLACTMVMSSLVIWVLYVIDFCRAGSRIVFQFKKFKTQPYCRQ